MLDDKNETIEELKQQLDQIKKGESETSESYNRLLKKYQSQGQIIEELE